MARLLLDQKIITLAFMVITLSGYQVSAVSYIKFDGIVGGAKKESHKGFSELISFSHSLGNSTNPAGTFEIKKRMDSASPKLTESMCGGEKLSNIEVEICSSSGHCYQKYQFSDAEITSYRLESPSNDDGMAIENISLSYKSIGWSYQEESPQGAKEIVDGVCARK